MVNKKQICKVCLRVVDLLDIIGLVVLNSIAIKAYVERETYSVSGFFLVTDGTSHGECDPQEAYEFSGINYADDARRIINRFNAFPVVLAVISLTIDLIISVYKLAVPISDLKDKQLTILEIALTLLFAPIAFPVSDFEYEDCLGTGLSDSIMESLGTYATLGLTMILWFVIIVASMIVIACVCKKNKEGMKKLMGLGVCALVILTLVYVGLALLFIGLALLGTVNSLATGLLTGFSGIIEALELYMAIRDLQDVKNKVGLGG